MFLRKQKKPNFFLRAIIRLFRRKVRNEVKSKLFCGEMLGDNFPGLYWRQA